MTAPASSLTDDACLEIAREMARVGVPVFVAYPDAESVTGYRLPPKWQETKANAGYVDAWQPGRALCAVMGQGLDLVDVDPRNGGSTDALNGSLPHVYGEAATPSGGTHFLVASLGQRSRDGFLPGLDYKGGDTSGQGRGFVFIAPTVRKSKTTGEAVPYRWVLPPGRFEGLASDGSGSALRELIKAAQRGSGGSSRTAPEAGDRIPEGQRNATLTSLAGSMRRRGMSQAAITAALLEENVARCDPPLGGDEVRAIAVSVSRYEPRQQEQKGSAGKRNGASPDLLGDDHGDGDQKPPAATRPAPGETPLDERLPTTDAGNAELFARLHRDRLRYDHKRGRWLEWAGHWWREDNVQAVVQLAIRAARYRFRQAESIEDLGERAAVAAWAVKSENRAGVEACLAIARSTWPLADDGDGWDAAPYLLGVENGVLDLSTGVLRDGRQEDYITKHAPVFFDPKKRCPTFDAFLERVQPDANLRAYLQRRAGYALTGDVGEQDLLFLHGAGANGKTTLANAVMDAMGRDYAIQAAPGLLLRSRGDRHPTELADLDGTRLVVSTEVQDGRALAEELVKQLTGGDRLKARRMRQDFYGFEATFKLVLLANHKPVIKGTDYAIWRRVKLVPWDVTVPAAERDPHLREKLKAEGSGILNWLLAGCLDWQRNGMREPPGVTAATEAYRTESDPLGTFLDDCCLVGEQYIVGATDLYGAYTGWALAQGISERDQARISQNAFGRMAGERFQSVRWGKKQTRSYRGVALLSERQEAFSPEKADAFGPKKTDFESDPSENPFNGPRAPSRELIRKNASNPSTRLPDDDDWLSQPEATL